MFSVKESIFWYIMAATFKVKVATPTEEAEAIILKCAFNKTGLQGLPRVGTMLEEVCSRRGRVKTNIQPWNNNRDFKSLKAPCYHANYKSYIKLIEKSKKL